MGLFDPDRSASRLPVSVITGFLGSGKTTLLNKLLRHPGMGDSAVIINEFGEVGLDHLLVEAVDGEIAVLPSGCVCCTLRSDLQQTLTDLLIRRDRAEIPPFPRILVETTGLADPAPIVQLLLPFQILAALMSPPRIDWRGHLMQVERGGKFRFVRRRNDTVSPSPRGAAEEAVE